ncbi:hypothetical protein PHLCEN_2v2225 [Hermanssonia centrifuga]|uniref:Uncharacterized protein n=1 Tax=Hermanssonia centrifuga TaxID=98765 RepID=A0A2R6RPN3_9APHY|nr:hypothetical protein PHLCEN_2v2225 [Hermanssonia centrifuga]
MNVPRALDENTSINQINSDSDEAVNMRWMYFAMEMARDLVRLPTCKWTNSDFVFA